MPGLKRKMKTEDPEEPRFLLHTNVKDKQKNAAVKRRFYLNLTGTDFIQSRSG